MRISDWSSDVCSSDLSWLTAVAIMRVRVSVPPPGGKGEMKVMGAPPRLAAPAAAEHDTSAAAARIFFRTSIVFLVYRYRVGNAAGAAPCGTVARFNVAAPAGSATPAAPLRYRAPLAAPRRARRADRKSTRLNSSH